LTGRGYIERNFFGPSGKAPSFTNSATGIFNINAEAGTVIAVLFTNNGTVNLNSGTLQGTSFTQSTGTLNNATAQIAFAAA